MTEKSGNSEADSATLHSTLHQLPGSGPALPPNLGALLAQLAALPPDQRAALAALLAPPAAALPKPHAQIRPALDDTCPLDSRRDNSPS